MHQQLSGLLHELEYSVRLDTPSEHGEAPWPGPVEDAASILGKIEIKKKYYIKNSAGQGLWKMRRATTRQKNKFSKDNILVNLCCKVTVC
jgi:hypothetical protein